MLRNGLAVRDLPAPRGDAASPTMRRLRAATPVGRGQVREPRGRNAPTVRLEPTYGPRPAPRGADDADAPSAAPRRGLPIDLTPVPSRAHALTLRGPRSAVGRGSAVPPLGAGSRPRAAVGGGRSGREVDAGPA